MSRNFTISAILYAALLGGGGFAAMKGVRGRGAGRDFPPPRRS